MKNKVAQFLMLAVLTLGLTVFAQAQNLSSYKANIPFDFIVGEQTFKAGKYSIEFGFLGSDRHNFLIRAVGGKQSAIVTFGTPKYGDPELEGGKLIFNVADEHYTLAEINTSQSGVELNKTRAKEKTDKPVRRVEVALAK